MTRGCVAALVAFGAVATAAPATVVQSVTRNGETITLRLVRQNLRGTNFQLLSQNASGAYVPVTAVAERSYLGTVDEYPGATSCGILQDDGTFRGAVYFDRGVTWFTSGTGVVGTRADDYGNFTGFQWPSAPTVSSGQAGSTTYGFELGVDADNNYFTTAGSMAKALEQIEFSVCAVRAIYQRDALLRPYLGRVIVRSTLAHDPYTGLTQGTYLDKVRTEWNSNQTDTDPDLVAGVSPTKIGGGLAWVGVVGTNSGYSVSQSGGTGAFDVVFRHEMGHNWDLPHYVGGSPEGAGIMGGNAPGRFSGPEVQRMLNHRTNRLSVLDAEGTFTAVALPPYASLDVATVDQGPSASVLVTPLANDHDANGQAITLAGFQSVSPNGGTITQESGGLRYKPGGSFLGLDRFSYTISDSTGKTATGFVLVDVRSSDRLRMYYTMDETTGTAADDRSVFNANGTLSGTDFGTASVTGKYGKAANLDGVDDHLTSDRVSLDSNTVTLTAWIKPAATPAAWAGILFDRSNGGSGLGFGNAGELRYHWKDGQYNWSSGLTPAVNAWTFVALVVEPTKATMYMNNGSGFQSAVNTTTHAAATFGNVSIGWDPSNGARHFAGAIDEARIYKGALSQAELASLVAGGGAEAPTPFDTASNVGPIDLTWAPSGAATGYRVFVGTSASAVASATTSSPEYQGLVTTARLENPVTTKGATNYWRVDTVTSGSTLTGNVWSFTRNSLEKAIITNSSFESGPVANGVPNGWSLTTSGQLGVGSGGSDGSQFFWAGPGTAVTQDLSHNLVAGETLMLTYHSSRNLPRTVQLLAKSGGTYQVVAESTATTGDGGWPEIQLNQTIATSFAGKQLALRIISGGWNEFDEFQITRLVPEPPVIKNGSFETGSTGSTAPPSWTQTAAGSLGVGSGGSQGTKYLWIGPNAALTQDLGYTLVDGETLTLQYNSSRNYPRNIQLLAKTAGTYQLIGETTVATGTSSWPTISFNQTVATSFAGKELAVRIISGNWNEFDNFRLSTTSGVQSLAARSSSTFAASEAPTISTGKAGNLTATSAEVTYSLTHDGGEATEATLWYGEADGGPSAEGWSNTAAQGTTTLGSHQAALAGLAAGTTYHFAASASNSAGTAWGSSGSFTTTADASPKLVRTTVAAVSSSSWTRVELGRNYNNPVIIATPVYPNSAASPVVTRIRNVGTSGFEVKLDRADGQTQPVTLNVSVIAVEEGVYTQAADGVTLEAVKYTSTVTAGRNRWTADARSYQNSYQQPVVIGQVMSANDPAWSTFWCSGASRTAAPAAASLQVGKHVGEDPSAVRANETIGYIVIEAGSGTIAGVPYTAGISGNTVRGVANSSTGYPCAVTGISSASAAAVSIAGMQGNDGAWAVLHGTSPMGAKSITVAVDEDQLGDNERSHGTERLGFIVFE